MNKNRGCFVANASIYRSWRVEFVKTKEITLNKRVKVVLSRPFEKYLKVDEDAPRFHVL
jgi:hypothetical protein